MTIDIDVENIKCGGCANTIRKALLQDERIRNVTVAVEAGRVSVDTDTATREEIATRLGALGYPESGSVAGFDSAKAKARSFVSCAIGRVTESES